MKINKKIFATHNWKEYLYSTKICIECGATTAPRTSIIECSKQIIKNKTHSFIFSKQYPNRWVCSVCGVICENTLFIPYSSLTCEEVIIKNIIK